MQSCDSPGLMPLAEALSKMLSAVSAINAAEDIDLLDANGRVLAQDVFSTVNVPPAANSAMDGYAASSQDLSGSNRLKLIGTSLAGEPYGCGYQANSCVRIMTGAVLPEGYDAVEMQENTVVSGDGVTFSQPLKPGQNIRQAGEDIAMNDLVLAAGTKLKAAELALLASIGTATVKVVRKVKVAIMATGNELTPPGQALKPGAIYESNRYALISMFNDWNCEVLDLGIVEDDKTKLQLAFDKAAKEADLIVTSGGVSVGDADYVKEVLEQIGEINFWKVAIKPGKPFAFGKIGNSWFCGLPGNPVSSFVTCQQLVLPILKRLSGETPADIPYFEAKLASKLFKRPGRADFQRGIYYREKDGTLMVKPNGKQGSGVMSSVAKANCYILTDQESGSIEAGELVNIQPFAFFN